MQSELKREYSSQLKRLDLDELLEEYTYRLNQISLISNRLRDVGPIVFSTVDEYGPHYMVNNAIMTQLVRNEINIRAMEQLEFDFSQREEVSYAY